MTKFLKVLFLLIIPIFMICTIVVPTYCYSSDYSIDLINEFPDNTNFYNLSNISYVKLKNFNISRYANYENCVFYCESVNYFSEYYDGQIINDNYDISFSSVDNILHVTSQYRVFKNSSIFCLYLLSWDIDGLSGFEIPFSSSYAFEFAFHFIPTGVLKSNFNYVGVHCYGGFDFSYDIDYQNQYFYNDTFCFTNRSVFSSGIGSDFDGIDFDYYASFYRQFTLVDNFDNSYVKKFDLPTQVFDNNYVKFSTSNISDVYIKSVNSRIDFGITKFIDTLSFRGGRLYFCFRLKFGTFDNTYTMPFYSANTQGQNSMSSPLIPTGSNSYYKTAVWYDIPTHLYNFFIYLIFDAPIISNFTKLAMVIINFLVETFNFVIGLFNGVSNVFFISIFVGMLALIFLLKIIFGGKT